MARLRLPPMRPEHWTILALAASRGAVSIEDHTRRHFSHVFGAGFLEPVPNDPPRSGRYRLSDLGRRARDRAARMSTVPPGEQP